MSATAAPPAALDRALRRYQVMAIVVGIGLLVLVLIGVPLQYGANVPAVANIVGPIHGILYIVYLLTVVDLYRRQRVSVPQLLAMIGAGFVPFLAFVIERRITARLAGQPAAADRPVAGGALLGGAPGGGEAGLGGLDELGSGV